MNQRIFVKRFGIKVNESINKKIPKLDCTKISYEINQIMRTKAKQSKW